MVFRNRRLLLSDDCAVELWDIDSTLCDTLFQHARTLQLYKRPEGQSFLGKRVQTRRNVAYFSDTDQSYGISKQTPFEIKAQPLTPILRELLQEVNKELNDAYTGIIVNSYENGMDSIGAHSDNPNSNGLHGIATISLGASRTCEFRSKTDPSVCKQVELKHASMYRMSKKFQESWTHAIPPDPQITSQRICLTFRRIKASQALCNACHTILTATSKCNVCEACYQQKLFKCTICAKPSGAEWECETCYAQTLGGEVSLSKKKNDTERA